MRCRDIEKRARRHRVRNSNSIDTKRGHLREIALYQLFVGIFAVCLVRPEGAVSNATNKERLTARRKKLALDHSSVGGLPQPGIRRQNRLKTAARHIRVGSAASGSGEDQRGTVLIQSDPIDPADFAT